MDGRIRLRQWLEGRLNSGYIPGLLWLDKSKAIFKIPWKHHSKHTWQEDDAAIFKDWAVVTGRYREGLDVPDWPMWKTRLRCALNKAPDIQEVRQHHNLHCDEPFKVYRFISKTESMWRANASRHASLIFDGVPCGGPGTVLGPAGGVVAGMPQFFSSQSAGIGGDARPPKSGACGPGTGGNHSGSCAAGNHAPTGVLQCASSKPITLIQKTEHGLIKLKCINIPVLQHVAPESPPVPQSQNRATSPPRGTSQQARPSFPAATTQQIVSTTACQQSSPKRAAVAVAAAALGRRCKLELVASDRDDLARQINPPQQQHQSQQQRRVCSATGPPPGSTSGVAVALSHAVGIGPGSGSTESSAGKCGGGGGGGHGLLETGALSGGTGQKIRLSDVMEPEMHQICLRIQHLDQRVSDMIVNNPNGCCIYFGRFDENLSTVGPEPIEPQIYQFVADCNKYCVDMLLDNMQRGVVLSISSNGSIYAEKLCKCATFVYRPGNNGDFYFVDKLARRDKMLIFDFRTFLEELHYFQRGLADKPHVELILAFGQQIKEHSSPDSLYVWCRLASCKAWFLLQRAISNQTRPVFGACRRVCSQSRSNYGVGAGLELGSAGAAVVAAKRAAIAGHDAVFITGVNGNGVAGASRVLHRIRGVTNDNSSGSRDDNNANIDVDRDQRHSSQVTRTTTPTRSRSRSSRTRTMRILGTGTMGALEELMVNEHDQDQDQDQDHHGGGGEEEHGDEEEEGPESGMLGVDQMMGVYGSEGCCLADELGLIEVAHEVSIEHATAADEFPPSLGHHEQQDIEHHHFHEQHPHQHQHHDHHEQQERHEQFGSGRSRFDYSSSDLSYQFETGLNYE